MKFNRRQGILAGIAALFGIAQKPVPINHLEDGFVSYIDFETNPLWQTKHLPVSIIHKDFTFVARDLTTNIVESFTYEWSNEKQRYLPKIRSIEEGMRLCQK